MGTEMGNWQSVGKQILQGRGLSGEVVDGLWRRVGVHRRGYVCVSQGRLSKRVEFPAVLTVKFFSKRKCGPEMGSGLS